MADASSTDTDTDTQLQSPAPPATPTEISGHHTSSSTIRLALLTHLICVLTAYQVLTRLQPFATTTYPLLTWLSAQLGTLCSTTLSLAFFLRMFQAAPPNRFMRFLGWYSFHVDFEIRILRSLVDGQWFTPFYLFFAVHAALVLLACIAATRMQTCFRLIAGAKWWLTATVTTLVAAVVTASGSRALATGALDLDTIRVATLALTYFMILMIQLHDLLATHNYDHDNIYRPSRHPT
ncbi:hypothetical protein GGI21_000008 [Coemansia aciculifera]|nr:hypothetical protein GGI21_000008 [Coemansia aciculifera]